MINLSPVILFMTEGVRPYYQASVSKTIFYPEDADPEDCGLEDYKKNEVSAVMDFVHSGSNLLVVGGISATGKSHLLHTVRRTESFDYYDLQALGDTPLRHAGCTDVAGCVRDMVAHVYDRPEGMTTPRGIMIDEGMVLANDETSDNFRAVIDELLAMYPQVIVAGGGSQYTGLEQAEIITGCMPADARIENLVTLIQTLNPKQGAELLMRRSEEIGKWVMDPEVARTIAESIFPYFNMPRILKRLPCWPDHAGKFYVHADGVIRSNIMPDEVYDPLWRKQVGIWRDKGLRDERY